MYFVIGLMNSVTIIFPNQLFNDIRFDKNSKLILWESNLHFTQLNFHKKKLILHRASMKYYADYLKDRGYDVEYLEFSKYPTLKSVVKKCQEKLLEKFYFYQPADYLITRRINRYQNDYKLKIEFIDNPNFFTKEDEFDELLGSKYFMAKFYQKQRKRFDILMEGDSPVGGKYSFDADNRKKLPKDYQSKPILQFDNDYINEAKDYVKLNFPENIGVTNDFFYPITHDEAKRSLVDFLEKRMEYFGDYEDAISKKEEFINHSLLTPALNIGLLTPKQIIDTTLKLNEKFNYSLNSLEGFIRQIIGWREFILGVYLKEGTKQRKSNFWGFENKMPKAFYDGTTGIEPVDDTIRKLINNAYNHHIERLMILGNMMMLLEIHPDEVYKWFMEFYIDAYDWVMVPNVYGMSQYADGGLITTKPYLSGSNYILKMSDYKKGDWCKIWDALYWRFIHKYQDKMKGNYRMGMMINLVNKKSNDQIDRYYELAEDFSQRLGIN